jgi:hypothetical protein
MMARRFTVYTSLLTGDFVVTFGNEAYSEGVPVATFKMKWVAVELAVQLNHTVEMYVETYEGAILGGK